MKCLHAMHTTFHEYHVCMASWALVRSALVHLNTERTFPIIKTLTKAPAMELMVVLAFRTCPSTFVRLVGWD